MKIKNLIFIVFTAFTVCGCATYDFFGMKAESAFRLDEIIIKDINKEKVIYLYNPRTINSDIFATANQHGRKYSVTVYNTTEMPLPVDSKKDKFYLMTFLNEKIYLTHEEYPLVDQIPTNKKLKFHLRLPEHLKTVKYGEIKALVCELGKYSYKTTIVLKNLRP